MGRSPSCGGPLQNSLRKGSGVYGLCFGVGGLGCCSICALFGALKRNTRSLTETLGISWGARDWVGQEELALITLLVGACMVSSCSPEVSLWPHSSLRGLRAELFV